MFWGNFWWMKTSGLESDPYHFLKNYFKYQRNHPVDPWFSMTPAACSRSAKWVSFFEELSENVPKAATEHSTSFLFSQLSVCVILSSDQAVLNRLWFLYNYLSSVFLRLKHGKSGFAQWESCLCWAQQEMLEASSNDPMHKKDQCPWMLRIYLGWQER